MKIKPMLARLQNALGQEYPVEQMVLLPGPVKLDSAETRSEKMVNLVVGYSGSSNSQAALDLTLWVAHQTRLVTQKQVMVHVVYVIESSLTRLNARPPIGNSGDRSLPRLKKVSKHRSGVAVVTRLEPETKLAHTRKQSIELCLESCHLSPRLSSSNLLEQADCILWQARCLAEEWRGSLEAHLRFGTVATELRQVVESEAADLLFLGCRSVNHPLAQQLTHQFPCPVLGIPAPLVVA